MSRSSISQPPSVVVVLLVEGGLLGRGGGGRFKNPKTLKPLQRFETNLTLHTD